MKFGTRVGRQGATEGGKDASEEACIKGDGDKGGKGFKGLGNDAGKEGGKYVGMEGGKDASEDAPTGSGGAGGSAGESGSEGAGGSDGDDEHGDGCLSPPRKRLHYI